jgi:hypothetical protein
LPSPIKYPAKIHRVWDLLMHTRCDVLTRLSSKDYSCTGCHMVGTGVMEERRDRSVLGNAAVSNKTKGVTCQKTTFTQ